MNVVGRPAVFIAALVTLASLAFFAVAATSATSQSAAAGVRRGQIAWKGFPRPGDETTSAIYAANPDGSHRRRLTHPASGTIDDLPDWSPDGSRIVFERIFGPSSNVPTIADEVMRVDADGSGSRQIGTCTGDCVANDDPQYSPDGRQIVYTRLTRAKGAGALAAGVWVMDSNGAHPHQVSPATAGDSEDHEPAWAPDGKRIVFTRLNDSAVPRNKQALFIMASTGGRPRRLTAWNLNAGGANWSPDGSRIVFQSYRDCSCTQTSQVYTVAVNGSRLTRLTTSGRNIAPNWAPNGKRIIYAHQPGSGSDRLPDLWVMDASGNGKGPLIRTRLWESEPDWGTAAPIS
jgi:Tol biopolymer transport system component